MRNTKEQKNQNSDKTTAAFLNSLQCNKRVKK